MTTCIGVRIQVGPLTAAGLADRRRPLQDQRRHRADLHHAERFAMAGQPQARTEPGCDTQRIVVSQQTMHGAAHLSLRGGV